MADRGGWLRRNRPKIAVLGAFFLACLLGLIVVVGAARLQESAQENPQESPRGNPGETAAVAPVR